MMSGPSAWPPRRGSATSWPPRGNTWGRRGGTRLITDGPFAETTEQLGGYFLIDADNLDDAIAIAGRIPAAAKGTIEVRPVFELDGLPTGK
jgi:hypothetical protein